MAQRPTARINTKNGDFYVLLSGGYEYVDNADSVNIGGATRSNTNQPTMNSGTYATSTPADVQTVTTSFSGINPTLAGHGAILDASLADTRLRCRYETEAETIVPQTASGVTVAISSTGAVTLAGTEPDFNGVLRGHSIRIGNNLHVIQRVDRDGKPTRVSAPSASVSASQYTIVNPIYRLEWIGIPSKPGQDTSSESPVASGSVTWSLESDTDLIQWTPITTPTAVA